MSGATIRGYVAPRPFGRRFAAILGLSVAVHGGLFLLNTWQRSRPASPLPPIVASLRPLAAAPSGSPAVAAPVPAAAIPQKVRSVEPRREKRSSPAVPELAGPAIAPAKAAVVAAAGSVPVAAAAPAATEAPAPAPAPVAAAPAVPAADLLAAYRQRLSQLLASQRDYPRVAALRGWEGEVRLRLRVARKGNLLGVALDRSSGFDVLDQHALAMLGAYASLPPLPEGLDGSEIQVVVPISYKLNKTT